MSFEDWLLALHLLSAFALVGAITLFSIAVFTVQRTDSVDRILALAPVMMLGNVSVAIGTLGTLLFGVWLAIAVDAYQVWDLWVILAIVGWAIAAGFGGKAGKLAGEGFKQIKGQAGEDATVGDLRDPRIARFHWLSTGVTLLILVDMIWKPGA